jgi:glycosyltransferase involved in cell wall biosynthesis
MKIGINAHLLSNQAGYRSAGIHGYIYNTLAALPSAAGSDTHLTAMVGQRNSTAIDGITLEQATLDTQSPLRRIIWEQAIQPFQLNRFDLYHAMAFVAPILPYQPPTVVTVYDLSFVHYPQVLSTARRTYLRAFTARTVGSAARVIAISESTARDVVETFGVDKKRVDVAPPGTNTDIYRPLPSDDVDMFRQQKRLPSNFWLFLGTLEPRKNLPTLLHAYAQLPKDSRPPLILGGGLGWDYQDVFDTIQAHNLEDEVQLPGYIPSEELPLWYNCADLFVFPSVFEGFGIPPLEAMACGTPVIVSDASSLPEVVVGTDNLLVPPLDIGAWVAALSRALDDSDWRKRAAHSGSLAAARFTWDNTAHQTWACYQQALGTR